ncbi:hypothetical protein IWW34DRAFT_742981, partial [Fusarium oxysporum f. sp. albedinis]
MLGKKRTPPVNPVIQTPMTCTLSQSVRVPLQLSAAVIYFVMLYENSPVKRSIESNSELLLYSTLRNLSQLHHRSHLQASSKNPCSHYLKRQVYGNTIFLRDITLTLIQSVSLDHNKMSIASIAMKVRKEMRKWYAEVNAQWTQVPFRVCYKPYVLHVSIGTSDDRLILKPVYQNIKRGILLFNSTYIYNVHITSHVNFVVLEPGFCPN